MKDLNYYLSLEYSVDITEYFDEVEGCVQYVASIKEFPGLEICGDTPKEAYDGILFAREDWFAFILELGETINEPESVSVQEFDKNTPS